MIQHLSERPLSDRRPQQELGSPGLHAGLRALSVQVDFASELRTAGAFLLSRRLILTAFFLGVRS